jgi:hypothetical protein
LAKENSCSVEFTFNGVTVVFDNKSNPYGFDMVLDAVKRNAELVLV